MANVALAELREKIRALEGGTAVRRHRVPSGVAGIDGLVQGLPSPGIVELHGPWGGGATQLGLELVAARQRQHQQVVWVDARSTFYPPGAAAHGVNLGELLVVRPSLDRVGWAVEQLLRSGSFPLVAVADPPTARRLRTGQLWALAAEKGQATAVVVTHPKFGRDGHDRAEVPAQVRLHVSRTDDHQREVVVLRDRGAGAAPPGTRVRL